MLPPQLYRTAAFLAVLGSAEAFNAAPLRPALPAVARMTSVRMEAEAPVEAPVEEEVAAPPAAPVVEYSEALPFLTRRASLGPKGALVGDVGFDPLGFTEILPLVRRAAQPGRARAAALCRARQESRAQVSR